MILLKVIAYSAADELLCNFFPRFADESLSKRYFYILGANFSILTLETPMKLVKLQIVHFNSQYLHRNFNSKFITNFTRGANIGIFLINGGLLSSFYEVHDQFNLVIKQLGWGKIPFGFMSVLARENNPEYVLPLSIDYFLNSLRTFFDKRGAPSLKLPFIEVREPYGLMRLKILSFFESLCEEWDQTRKNDVYSIKPIDIPWKKFYSVPIDGWPIKESPEAYFDL